MISALITPVIPPPGAAGSRPRSKPGRSPDPAPGGPT
jgi:hypothetical protein